MYRIRFHGRGGQGMKTASRILGTALFDAGFEVQDAPRYGAERRGAPIFAYVRADRREIYERGIIINPDLVVVADDSLVAIPAASVTEGIDQHSVMLLYSATDAKIWRERLNLNCRIIVLPATEGGSDRCAQPYLGTTCAAAAARLTGLISSEGLKSAIEHELSGMKAETVQANISNAMDAYEAVAADEATVQEGGDISADNYRSPCWVEMPFEAATISSPAIHAGATSVMVNTGLWRTLRPVVDPEQCKKCWWVCSSFCPDGAINVTEDGMPEIDYDHCKGCLICLAQCPSHAITSVPEAEAVEAKERQ